MARVPDPNPLMSMAIAAAGLHELFLSYMNAGFRRHEAFELCKAIMVSSIQAQPKADEDS